MARSQSLILYQAIITPYFILSSISYIRLR